MDDRGKIVGRIIDSIEVDPHGATIKFRDGSRALIVDEGQCCYEHRYCSTDDDASYHDGATLLDIDVAKGPGIDDCQDCHETQFVNIRTDRGVVQLVNHNVHNGYYGGFDLNVSLR